jgi:hypothetical protein
MRCSHRQSTPARVLILFFVALAPSVRAADATAEPKLFVAPDHSFSLRYPAAWKAIEKPPQGAIAAFASPDGTAAAVVQVNSQQVPIAAVRGQMDQMLPIVERVLARSIPEFKMIKSEIGKAGATPCIRMTFDGAPAPNLHARFFHCQILGEKGTRPLILTATVPANAAAADIALVQAIADSFAVPAASADAPAAPEPKPAPAATATPTPAPATPETPAPTQTTAAVELIPFKAPDESFSISYPKGWEAAPGVLKAAFPGSAGVFVHASEQGGAPEVLAISAIPMPEAVDPKNFAVWAKGFKNGLIGQLPRAKLIGESQITVGGLPAARLVLDNSDAAGNTARFIQIGFAKGNIGYSLTLVTDPKNFEKFLPIEQAIVASFAFKGSAPAAAATAATPTAPATETTPATPAAPPAITKTIAGIEMVRWQAADNAFALFYPKTWEKAPDTMTGQFNGATLIVTNAGEPGGQPDILAAGSTAAAPLEQVQNPKRPANAPPVYRRDLKTWVKSKKDPLVGKPGYKLVTESQVTLAGASGLRLVYDANDAAGNTGRYIQIFVEKGPTEYQLTFVTDPKRFAKFQSIEQAITRSFVIAPKPGDATADTTTPQTTPEKPEKPAPTATTETPKATAPVAADVGPVTAFESPDLGLKLNYPNTWTPRKSSAPGLLLMLLPTQMKPGARPSTLTLTADAIAPGQPPSFKEAADAALSTFKATALDAKVVESADVRIGKTPARRILIAGHNSITKADTRSLHLFVAQANNLLTLTGQSPADDFDALKQSFDAVVASIELSTPAQPKKAQ